MAQVCRYIDQHWANADLTPAVAATGNGLSERGLHMLFQPTDTSFAQHVQRRRLEECRSMLASPAHAERSIADIAFACGFNSLATFYRGFHRLFDVSPGELRAAPVPPSAVIASEAKQSPAREAPALRRPCPPRWEIASLRSQ